MLAVITIIIIIVWLSAYQPDNRIQVGIIKKMTGLRHNDLYKFLCDRVRTMNAGELQWAPGYTQRFWHGRWHQNIVFQMGNQHPDADKILIMAHYDRASEAPGGNDNMSGVFALLCVADFVRKIAHPKNIIFAITDGEETDLMGAYHIRSQISPSCVINIDTIGGFPDGSDIIVATNGNHQFFEQWGVRNGEPVRITGIIAGRSDISLFLHSTCIEFGAILGKYHSADDTYENLNIKNMKKIIQLIIDFIAGGIAPRTPT